MDTAPFSTPSAITTRLINALHVEAMVLADEARSYFDSIGSAARSELQPIERVLLSCESLKVTTRLMHVIAWLLVQRAAGDSAQTDSGGMQALPTATTVASETDTLARLPGEARALIIASIDLFDRVQRLDRDMRSGEPRASAARLLHKQLARAY